MKKHIVISAFLLLLPIVLEAQNRDYSYEQIRAAYEGTWRYENAKTQEVFVLKLLYKPLYEFNKENPLPYFIGFFSYSKMGISVYDYLKYEVEYSSFATMDEIMALSSDMIPITGGCNRDMGVSAFLFYDVLLRKGHPAFPISVERMDDKNDFLYWDMTKPTFSNDKNDECILSGSSKESCSIPMKMTLTRVK